MRVLNEDQIFQALGPEYGSLSARLLHDTITLVLNADSRDVRDELMRVPELIEAILVLM